MRDGTEVLTDNDEAEIFDHEEEDKDLESQVAKGQAIKNDISRGTREETPGPEEPDSIEKNPTHDSRERSPSDTSMSNTTANSDSAESTKPKIIPESALPDKLVTSPSIQEKK